MLVKKKRWRIQAKTPFSLENDSSESEIVVVVVVVAVVVAST